MVLLLETGTKSQAVQIESVVEFDRIPGPDANIPDDVCWASVGKDPNSAFPVVSYIFQNGVQVRMLSSSETVHNVSAGHSEFPSFSVSNAVLHCFSYPSAQAITCAHIPASRGRTA